MHNSAFRKTKTNGVYFAQEVKPEDLRRFTNWVRKSDIHGFNVTVPHKERIIPYLDKISPKAKLISAVNTVIVKNKKLYGYNTDGYGFIASLKQDLGFKPRGKSIFIIGAGGAARAIGFLLAASNAKVIKISEIDKKKGKMLCRQIKKAFPKLQIEFCNKITKENLQDADLLVNATPIGLRRTDPALVNARILHRKLKVYDVIYNPAETKLIKAAKKKRIRAANGLGMLLYQGALAFELWTGKRAPVKVMKLSLRAR